MRKKRFLLRQSALVLIRVQAASLFPPGSALPKVASSPVLPEGGHAGQGAPAPILGSPGPKRAVLSMGCAGSSHCFCATNIGRPFFPDSFVSNIPSRLHSVLIRLLGESKGFCKVFVLVGDCIPGVRASSILCCHPSLPAAPTQGPHVHGGLEGLISHTLCQSAFFSRLLVLSK